LNLQLQRRRSSRLESFWSVEHNFNSKNTLCCPGRLAQ
jgi:hypothetical protein